MADDIVTRLRQDFITNGQCDYCEQWEWRGHFLDCPYQSAADEIERLQAEVSMLMAGLEYAWVVIANGQYSDTTDVKRHTEWEQAKFRFRDEHWHPALGRNIKAVRGD